MTSTVATRNLTIKMVERAATDDGVCQLFLCYPSGCGEIHADDDPEESKRIRRLEAEVATLKERLEELRQHPDDEAVFAFRRRLFSKKKTPEAAGGMQSVRISDLILAARQKKWYRRSPACNGSD
jgi:hypothetical protein